MLDDRRPIYRAEREALREMLSRDEWTFFVTLTFSDPTTRPEWMYNRLKNWDQRTNRRILGSAYRDKEHERVEWMAFPEKFNVNPHWHLAVKLTPKIQDLELTGGRKSFSGAAKHSWCKLVPRGTVDIRPIDEAGVNDYITK